MSKQGEFGYGAVEGKRTRYEDGSGGFGSIVKKVSDGIFKINNSVSLLEKAVRKIGTPNDSDSVRRGIQNTLQTTKEIVTTTARCLGQLKEESQKSSKQEQLQCGRLANEFQDTVKRYGDVQKRVVSKMRSCPNLPASSPDECTDENASLVDVNRRQEQLDKLQQQQVVIDGDSALIEEREERIRQIEGAMLDVNEIFRDLSAMVSEQGEIVDSIEANIDRADSNVVCANEQLVTASQYQKKARRKMCCIFIILAVVAAIVGLILYITLK